MVSHSHELLRQIPVMIYFKYWLAAPARLSARNATTTTAVTSAAGRCVHVSLNLVDPPGLFRWFVHCPGLMRRNAASTGSSSPSPPMLFYSSRGRVIDYSVYRGWPHALWHFQLYPQSQLVPSGSPTKLRFTHHM